MQQDNCSKKEVIEIIRQDLAEVKTDVKKILAYNNKLIGFTIGVSSTVTVIFNIIVFIFKR
jgi:hypothetical protein